MCVSSQVEQVMLTVTGAGGPFCSNSRARAHCLVIVGCSTGCGCADASRSQTIAR